MMKNANSLLMDLEEQMNMIGLPLMALKLDELYRSSDFLTMDRLEMVSSLLKPEYEDKTTKRFNNRLRTARLIGTPCDISQCRDSSQRRYEPTDAPKVLSTLQFIEDGLNVCILGPSDSGKTFLAKSLGVAACEKYRVNYCHCSELLERLVAAFCGAERTPRRFRADAMQNITDALKRSKKLLNFLAGSLLCNASSPA